MKAAPEKKSFDPFGDFLKLKEKRDDFGPSHVFRSWCRDRKDFGAGLKNFECHNMVKPTNDQNSSYAFWLYGHLNIAYSGIYRQTLCVARDNVLWVRDVFGHGRF